MGHPFSYWTRSDLSADHLPGGGSDGGPPFAHAELIERCPAGTTLPAKKRVTNTMAIKNNFAFIIPRLLSRSILSANRHDAGKIKDRSPFESGYTLMRVRGLISRRWSVCICGRNARKVPCRKNAARKKKSSQDHGDQQQSCLHNLLPPLSVVSPNNPNT